ncbi:hypothetical protein GQX73_g2612 [Xylaria multiplex]|uniref:DUF7820 domain-containing protein n=1 Tax=Xylaria multiplex TaxID=323545 RepID=A0A7C8MXL8_9PEZI|nr:hypothetical protein GQX73_g2612 [Xylaria multiplex]
MGDSRNTKSSELDRSASRRASTRLSHMLRDGDDDDYDFQAMAISDGFRPAQVSENHMSHVPRPSLSSLDPPVARAVSRPSSVSKPLIGHEPLFSIPYNGVERTPARSLSVSTDSHVMAAETPYEGPRGPSHPYQMYPQDVRVARTASLATTSTAPLSERSYNGPSHPTHPYGIYPQNVGTGDDGSGDRPPQREINVGFPGTADNYQRRIGPDGEEAADMIGPDGHTEQLPPYTRYPVDAYVQKTPGIDATRSIPTTSSIPTSSTQQQQTIQNLEIPGAGGIGLATRNPEFSSTEDLNQLSSRQSRRSIRSFTSETSHHSINTAALAITNEKETSNWRTAARRKVWGVVPCWALVLGAIVLLLLGVVVGTVLGTVIAPQLHKNGPHKNLPDSTTGPPGYVPLTTVPAGLPPLAEGAYALPLMSPRFSQTCFQDTSQGKAWNCDAILSQLTVSIQPKPDSTEVQAYALDLTYNTSYTEESFVYSYGVQPPRLLNKPLELVNDTFERSRGPAWALALRYNKTIILPEEYLTHTSSDVQRRMMFGFDFKRKGLAQSGEKPWICTWPETILEIFIYAGQNNSFKYPMAPTSSGATSSTPLPTESSTGTQSSDTYHRDAIGQPHDHSGQKDIPYTSFPTERPTSSSATISTTSQTTDTSSERNWFSPPPMPPPPLPPYPKIVKVEERRDPETGDPVPTCRQVEIIGKGIQARPVLDNGQPVVIQIAETTPESEQKEAYPYFKRRSFGPHLWDRGDDGSSGNELSSCGCIWWLT